jgi:hypothetical protein
MTPLPKKKHSKGRTGRRRGGKNISLRDVYTSYSRAKGIEKKKNEIKK